MMADEDAPRPTYRGNPLWSDVVPVPQDDGADAPAPIAYSAEYTEVMDYFRGVLATKERSKRVLDLITHIVSLNPSNYSVWQYRREVLKATGADLNAELSYIASLLVETPKNYQLWYHRQVLVALLHDASNEPAFLRTILLDDGKNYHAWGFRQWLLESFPELWPNELPFVEELLTIDVRNNSAWNQRYYILQKYRLPTDAVLKEELEYVFSKIERAPNNESAWNYLQGLVDLRTFADLPQVEEFCVGLRDRGIMTSFLFSMLADIFESKGQHAQAAEVFNLLAQKLDTIRSKYWEYRQAVALAKQ